MLMLKRFIVGLRFIIAKNAKLTLSVLLCVGVGATILLVTQSVKDTEVLKGQVGLHCGDGECNDEMHGEDCGNCQIDCCPTSCQTNNVTNSCLWPIVGLGEECGEGGGVPALECCDNGSVVLDGAGCGPCMDCDLGEDGDDLIGECVLIPNCTVCGNGVVEAGEECDDGNSNNNDSCTNNCFIRGSCCEGLSCSMVPSYACGGTYVGDGSCTVTNCCEYDYGSDCWCDANPDSDACCTNGSCGEDYCEVESGHDNCGNGMCCASCNQDNDVWEACRDLCLEEHAPGTTGLNECLYGKEDDDHAGGPEGGEPCDQDPNLYTCDVGSVGSTGGDGGTGTLGGSGGSGSGGDDSGDGGDDSGGSSSTGNSSSAVSSISMSITSNVSSGNSSADENSCEDDSDCPGGCCMGGECAFPNCSQGKIQSGCTCIDPPNSSSNSVDNSSDNNSSGNNSSGGNSSSANSSGNNSSGNSSGGNSSGNSSSDGNTHTECKSGACVVVIGEGPSECIVSDDCFASSSNSSGNNSSSNNSSGDSSSGNNSSGNSSSGNSSGGNSSGNSSNGKSSDNSSSGNSSSSNSSSSFFSSNPPVCGDGIIFDNADAAALGFTGLSTEQCDCGLGEIDLHAGDDPADFECQIDFNGLPSKCTYFCKVSICNSPGVPASNHHVARDECYIKGEYVESDSCPPLPDSCSPNNSSASSLIAFDSSSSQACQMFCPAGATLCGSWDSCPTCKEYTTPSFEPLGCGINVDSRCCTEFYGSSSSNMSLVLSFASSSISSSSNANSNSSSSDGFVIDYIHTECINNACTIVAGHGKHECLDNTHCTNNDDDDDGNTSGTNGGNTGGNNGGNSGGTTGGDSGGDDYYACISDAECSIGICVNGDCTPCLVDNECTSNSCNRGQCRPKENLVAAASVCGNGILETKEECDDSNRRDNDGCSSTCLLEIGLCGDGIVQSLLGEQCEQSTHSPTLPYSCINCRFATTTCGNGTIEQGEECDAGTQNSTSPDALCRPDCSLSRCGDGVIDSTELCDDGNRLNGDSCDRYCRTDNGDTLVASDTTIGFPDVSLTATVLPGYMQQQFPQYPNLQQLPYQLPLAQLQPLIQSQGPIGDTGPAAVAVVASGAAAGLGWMRRKRK